MVSMFVKRTIVYVLDFFVVSSFMWIISFLLSIVANPYSIYAVYHYFVYVVPILIMVYFVFCEKLKKATVGKALMYIQVVSEDGGNISYSQAIIRNLSKIYWIPIIFDWAIGKIIKADNRILAKISKTVVISELQD
jgi:uncharacterized RDD family membrane protein YckC